MSDRLYRSRDDRMLAGVASGLAETIDADPSIIRVVWVLLVFLTGGLALVVYIVMAIVVPERPAGVGRYGSDAPAAAMGGASTTPGGTGAGGASAPGPTPAGNWGAPDPSTAWPASPPRRPRRDRAGRGGGALIAGLLLILLGGLFLVRQLFPLFDLGSWWPLAAVGLGVVLVVISIAPSRPSN